MPVDFFFEFHSKEERLRIVPTGGKWGWDRGCEVAARMGQWRGLFVADG